jgi:beta-ribofuranosylaminobenzene 5'-phosphate synthase
MFELRTACRLHFGLMELANSAQNRYSGLGVMLNYPRLLLSVSKSPRNRVQLPQQSLDLVSMQEYSQRITAWQQRQSVATHIQVVEAFPFHSGLGTGTQLACLLSLASYLEEYNLVSRLTDCWKTIDNVAELSAEQLAELSGRGLRSAIGIQGFISGGLVLDIGYHACSPHPRPIQTTVVEVPDEWRVVLIRGTDNSAITGPVESSMIGQLALDANPNRSHMMELAQAALQAAQNGSFDCFCDSLDQYTKYASEMFAPLQGGRYNGSICSLAANVAHQYGLKGIGQSSWGPTIFGWSESELLAQSVVQRIQQQYPAWSVSVATTARRGAQVRLLPNN